MTVQAFKQVSLAKAGQQYIFRYREGDEESLIKALTDMARDDRTNFDWFDAAVLSRQVNETLLKRLEK